MNLKTTGVQIVFCGVVAAAYGMYVSYVDPQKVGLALLGIMLLIVTTNTMMSLFSIQDRLDKLEAATDDSSKQEKSPQ